MESLHPLKKWIGEHTTQAQFARDLAISESHLSGILKGAKVSLELALRLSRATGGAVPVEAFAKQPAAAQ
jgi:plasmid maintenance system antidote protein VapI